MSDIWITCTLFEFQDGLSAKVHATSADKRQALFIYIICKDVDSFKIQHHQLWQFNYFFIFLQKVSIDNTRNGSNMKTNGTSILICTYRRRCAAAN